jgi:4-hydroxybenzoate polyprenyltransferase
LAFSYVSATSSNDIADEAIDAINHPKSTGRPLITGHESRRDMWIMFWLASLATLACAAFLSIHAIAIMIISACLNVLYSLPPARLSYRTYFAPLVLGLAYVGVPYALAMAVLSQPTSRADSGWFIGLYLLFVGRILLKDFRDRAGDRKYHKPTFLLRYGKKATCLTSASILLVGGCVLAWQVHSQAWLTFVVVAYIASILFMLWRLYQADEGKDEQLAIGVGAKMGNGLLMTLLGYFLLAGSGVQPATVILLTTCITIVYGYNFALFLLHPERAVIGYKG